MGDINRKSKQSNSGAKSTGSRFVVLDDQEGMEIDMNELKWSESLGTDFALGAHYEERRGKEKVHAEGTSDVEVEAHDEVHLNVSHVELTTNLKNLSKIGPEIIKWTINPSVGRLKKTKENVLSDITNQLEVRPVKLNQSQAESKLGSEHQPRDKGIKHINQMWADEDEIKPMDFQGQSDLIGPALKTWANGSTGSHPLDCPDLIHDKDPTPSLNGIWRNFGG